MASTHPYQPLAYDDADSAPQMSADCQAVEAALHLPSRRTTAELAALAAAGPAPSIRYEDFPRDIAKPDIAVSEAAARLGAALHLHLD